MAVPYIRGMLLDNINNIGRERFLPDDPFQFSDRNFIKMYRFQKQDVNNLEEMLEPFLPLRRRQDALSNRVKILSTLRFFAGGSYQLDIGRNHAVTISQPSVSRSLHEVLEALNHPAIVNNYIHYPNTLEELRILRQSLPSGGNTGVISLELEKLLVPSHSVRNTSVTMECHYKLGDETLYSVKWYKDGNEFYRYVPRNQPPAQVFPLPGVTVDLHNSTEFSVVLSSVQLSTSGRYRCEVSGEAPYFETVTDHAYMMVVALPKVGPEITGGQKRYHVGDVVNVTCSTKESKPAAHLNWMINGEPADPKYVRGPYKQFVGREGLESTSLVLEFVARPKHFKRGNMKLKCLATIATVYTTNNEKSYEGERPQKGLVLESRGTVAPPGSRADRVHTSGSMATASVLTTSITRIIIIAWLYLNRVI